MAKKPKGSFPASTEVADNTPPAPDAGESAQIETEQHDGQRDRQSDNLEKK
jgi:hypothetical protein